MNDSDFSEIDRHLQKCMDMGYTARLNGLTKYENEFEPGSLSFDAWAEGFHMPEHADALITALNKKEV